MNKCSLIDVHAMVDTDGKVRPCCRFNSLDYDMPDINDGLAAAVAGPVFSDIRQRMNNNERLDNCNKCWQQEESTGNSMRTFYNDMYYPYNTVTLKYLEVGFSTHCNLACRMCSADYSSKWATIMNPGKTVSVGYNLDVDAFDVDLSMINLIKIVGGEPMMAPQHDKFVEKLLDGHCDLSKLTLVYFTNATKMPTPSIISFWKKVKHVIVNFSIDGYNEVNEYQRPGHKWSTIQDTIDRYKLMSEEINITMYTHCVVTVLNVLHMKSFYKWHQETFGDNDSLSVDVTESPDHLSLRNQTAEFKERAITYISANVPYDLHRSRLIAFLQQPARDNIEYTTDDIGKHERPLDEYFNQELKL